MNKILTTAAVAALLTLGITPALAAGSPSQPPVGEQTRSLLQAQRDGSHASTHSQNLSAEAAKLAYQRWLNSFKQPIPDSFGSGQAAAGTAAKP